MKLSFDQLEVKGFRSIGQITLDLAGGGLVFVQGRNEREPHLGQNGAGKSSVFSALSWALYGRTPDGLRTPDIRPWNGQGPPWAHLSLAIDQTPHTIERLASSPNKPTLDGNVVGQEDVEALIGLSFPVFCQTVLFGQGRPLFFDLEPKDKMQLFAEVLNLERWELRSAAASAEVDQLAEHIRAAEAEITEAQGRLAETITLADQLSGQADLWAANRRNAVELAEKTLKQNKARIAELQPKYDSAEMAYDSAETELKPLRKEERAMLVALNSHRHAVGMFQERHRTLEREQKELIELRRLSGTHCPTCGQPLKGKDAKQAQADLDKQLADNATKLKGSTKAVKEGERKLQEFETACSAYGAKIVEFEIKADAAEGVMRMHNAELITLKARVQEVEAQVREREEQVNPFRAQLQAIAASQKKLRAQIESAQINSHKLQRSSERAKFWIKGFKDVRLYVIEEVLQELEVTTNAILEDIGLPGWSVQYAVERETAKGGVQRGITVVINGQDGTGTKPVNFNCWSGGEAQRLRLVGALALSEVLLDRAGVTTNLEILDEPTQHMTHEGAAALTGYLAERAQQLDRTVFYVDHLARQSRHFKSVLTIVKGKDGSYIKDAA